MEHDKLCPALHPSTIDAQICTFCELIRAAREDERACILGE